MEFRQTCSRCRLALTACYCEQVRPIATRPLFVILRHPLERRKRIGTGRMAHLCLRDSRLIDGIDFSRSDEVNTLIGDPSNSCVVLFPGSRAVPLEQASFAAGRRPVVFVIDGTWTCARKVMRLSTNLAALPWVGFTPERPSEYRIRRQPAPHCLSTIEAIDRVLASLDAGADRAVLLEVFRSMVSRQAGFGPARN